MKKHLSLVQSDFETLEKRVLPRFPFCYLLFKNSENSKNNVYEIKDISRTGMQLCLKSGSTAYVAQESLKGIIHWIDKSLEVIGKVKWVKENRVGVEFSSSSVHREKVDELLDVKNFASSLRPIHLGDFSIDLPLKLKYWLRSDGPAEVFIWCHDNGEFSKFQILIMENFIEWEDLRGLKTGRVISKRDIETPLITEDEFVFKLDQSLDEEKLKLAKELIKDVENSKLDRVAYAFLKLKLGF